MGTGGRVATLCLAVALALACASPAFAAQRFADPAGDASDTSCPQNDPCDLDTAVEHGSVVDGDEVVVAAGTYDTFDVNVSDAIDLHGAAGQARPTVNVTSSFGVFVADTATVRRLRIENPTGPAIATPGGMGVTIEQVIAHASGGGWTACSVTGGTIRDSVCWASGANAKGLGSNLSASSSNYSVTLRNVTAVANGPAPGYGIGYDFNGTGVNFTMDAKAVIADGPSADVRAAASGAGMTTTIALDHSNYATEQEVGTTGGIATVTDPGTGTNQTAAPQFVNAPAGDFHQLSGSPTKDSGDTDGSSGAVDVDGDPRTQGPAADMGAYEFDGIPPQTQITSGPAHGSTIASSDPSFGFDSNEPGSTFECKVDGAAFGVCSGPGSSHTASNLADGAHSFQVRATDPAGNTDDTPEARNFTVDTTGPTASITSGPAQGSKTSDPTPTFGFQADEPGSTFECQVDGGAFSACSGPGASHTTGVLGDGPHTFGVRATDPLANLGPAASRSFTVDTSRSGGGGSAGDTDPPETTIDSGPKRKTKKRKAKLKFSADEPFSTFECSLDGKDLGPCDPPFKKKVKRKRHSFEVVATDPAGNTDPTPAEHRWKVKKKRKK